MEFGEHLQLLIQHIAHQLQAVGRIVVLYVAVDAVLVNTLSQQLADDDKNVWVITIKGEKARVRCHACIDVFGSGKGEVLQFVHCVQQTENQLARTAQLRMRNDVPKLLTVRVKMMVDEQALAAHPLHGHA